MFLWQQVHRLLRPHDPTRRVDSCKEITRVCEKLETINSWCCYSPCGLCHSNLISLLYQHQQGICEAKKIREAFYKEQIGLPAPLFLLHAVVNSRDSPQTDKPGICLAGGLMSTSLDICLTSTTNRTNLKMRSVSAFALVKNQPIYAGKFTNCLFPGSDTILE